MTGINLQSIIVKKEDILSSVVDEETVLLSIETSKYYGIDPVGTAIWELLDTPQSIAEIIGSLQENYNVSEERCRADVYHFITHLIDKKLVQIQGE